MFPDSKRAERMIFHRTKYWYPELWSLKGFVNYSLYVLKSMQESHVWNLWLKWRFKWRHLEVKSKQINLIVEILRKSFEENRIFIHLEKLNESSWRKMFYAGWKMFILKVIRNQLCSRGNEWRENMKYDQDDAFIVLYNLVTWKMATRKELLQVKNPLCCIKSLEKTRNDDRRNNIYCTEKSTLLEISLLLTRSFARMLWHSDYLSTTTVWSSSWDNFDWMPFKVYIIVNDSFHNTKRIHLPGVCRSFCW